MSFYSSAILGFFLYLILRMTHLVHTENFDKIYAGKIVTIIINKRSHSSVRLGLLLTLAFLLFLGVLRYIHPTGGYVFDLFDVLTGPKAASSIFGLGLGWLSAHVAVRLLRTPDDYVWKSSDWFSVGCVAFLLMLGIGGEEFLKSFGSRLNKLSFGGAELSLSEAPQSAASAHARGPSTIATGTRADERQANGSQGLALVAGLSDTIKRDQEYIDLIRTSDAHDDLRPDLDRVRRMSNHTLVPVASCLLTLYRSSADATELNDRVSALSKPLKLLITPHADEVNVFEDAVSSFAEQADLVAVDAYRTSLNDVLQNKRKAEDTPTFEGCKALVAELCERSSPNTTPADIEATMGDWLKGNMPAANECLRLRAASEDRAALKSQDAPGAPDFRKARDGIKVGDTEWFKAAIGTALPTPAKNDRELAEGVLKAALDKPYLAIAYAGLSAQLRHYEAAAFALHQRIGQATNEHPFEVSDWIAIRTRLTLSSVIQEWLDDQGDTAPSSLLNYHVKNFEATIGLFRKIPKVEELVDKTGTLPSSSTDDFSANPSDDGVCNVSREASTMLESYIGAVNSYVDNALRAVDYSVANSGTISGRANFVKALNLKCIETNRQTHLRAESLWLWSRSEANKARLGVDVKGADWSKTRLGVALEAAKLADSVIHDDYERDRTEKQTSTNLLDAIQTTDTMALHQRILGTEASIKEARESLD